MTGTGPSNQARRANETLRLGFVPLTDCAPLAVAHEFGLFRRRGLRVALRRELGWATIRDKVIHGELHAAHAVAGMPFAATLGLGSTRCDCLTALVLNLHGNAITFSQALWSRGVRDSATLRAEVGRSRGRPALTFGVVHPFASHNFLLRNWLLAAGILPERDVRIVVVPPPQMTANLRAGHLDGFCVGEPWNSLAVQSKAGWIAGTSAELDPGHPEKVLMARRDFAEKREAEHLALVAALLEACAVCEAPAHREAVIHVLARPEYVNVPAAVLRRGLAAPLDWGQDIVRAVPDFCVFHGRETNEPSGDKAAWVLRNVRNSGLCPEPAALNFQLGRSVFRADLFAKAQRLCRPNPPDHEKEPTLESQFAPA